MLLLRRIAGFSGSTAGYDNDCRPNIDPWILLWTGTAVAIGENTQAPLRRQSFGYRGCDVKGYVDRRPRCPQCSNHFRLWRYCHSAQKPRFSMKNKDYSNAGAWQPSVMPFQAS